jgi:hypothetical protein
MNEPNGERTHALVNLSTDDTARFAAVYDERPARYQLPWEALLLAIVVLGNVLVPTLLQTVFAPTGFRANDQFSLYEATCLGLIGLWIAQYVAVWLWVNSSNQTTAIRYFLGAFLSSAITYLVLFGLTAAWGPGPSRADVLMIMVLVTCTYFLAGWLMHGLFRHTQISWKPRGSGIQKQFSIRTLLGMTAVSAVGMLALSRLPFGRFNLMYGGDSMVSFAIWIVWISLAAAVVIWLLVGSFRAAKPWVFRASLLTFSVLAPWVFQAVAVFLWGMSSQSIVYEWERYFWVYAVEAGLILGVAAVLPWVSPNQALASAPHPTP